MQLVEWFFIGAGLGFLSNMFISFLMLDDQRRRMCNGCAHRPRHFHVVS